MRGEAGGQPRRRLARSASARPLNQQPRPGSGVLPPLSPHAWLRFDAVQRLLPGGYAACSRSAPARARSERSSPRYAYVGLEPDAASFAVAEQRIGPGRVVHADDEAYTRPSRSTSSARSRCSSTSRTTGPRSSAGSAFCGPAAGCSSACLPAAIVWARPTAAPDTAAVRPGRPRSRAHGRRPGRSDGGRHTASRSAIPRADGTRSPRRDWRTRPTESGQRRAAAGCSRRSRPPG